MKELSLHILDIAQNSVKAGASRIGVDIAESETQIAVTVTDDGCGMASDMLSRVTDPYTTTRDTRRVGLGIPLLKLAAEQSGGGIELESQPGKGTRLRAVFEREHLDRPPLGDMVSTMVTLIQGSPELDFAYRHVFPDGREATLDTAVLRGALEGVSLAEPDVLQWIAESLNEEELREDSV